MNSVDVNSFVDQLTQSVSLFLPETVLIVTFIVALIADLIIKRSNYLTGVISLIGFALTAFFLAGQSGESAFAFSRMLVVDPFALFFKWVILLSSAIVVIMSFFSKELLEESNGVGEYYSLIVGMTVGMFLLSSASNLIMIYLAIETMSLSSYVLAGYTREIKRASEASLKYVIFGALSSGIMIYGISILFGLTGTLNLLEINQFLLNNDVSNVALFVSGLMIIAGMAYKISAVPFHFWTPDVYEGAPVTITALLSVASKAAGFAVLIRFVKTTLMDPSISMDAAWNTIIGIDWSYLIAVLAVVTMTLGNIVAVWQSNVKRMLAYSSIAHAGYLLMGVTVMTDAGISAILIYFMAYMIMNLGAFYVVMLIANKINSEELDDYQGIGYRTPILAACMTVFLISLTGLPPTFGFIGKLWLFSAVIESGMIWLAVIGVLNSVVSLFYYTKVIRNMYLRDVESKKEKLIFSPAAIVFLFILAVPTILLFIWFGPILDWAKSSVGIFMG